MSAVGDVSGSDATMVGSGCSWKWEPIDSDSVDAAVLKPRTCYECLNQVPEDGQECKLLTLSGMCISTATTDASELVPAPSANSSALLASSSEYCELNDATCAACLYDTKSTSALCYGSDDCVCLNACADSVWSSRASQLLASMIAQDCAQNATAIECAMFDLNSSSTPASSVPVPTASAVLDTKASDNRCMWETQYYGDMCGRPRSCYDCLNTPVSGTECTITSEGYCTTMDAYVSKMDYRLNASDAAPHFFPSSNTVYCESSDETCAACRDSATFANAMAATMDTTAFCLGEDGCVCVAFCELPYYDQLVGAQRCNTTSSTAAASTVLGVSIRVIALVSALCISLPVVIIVCFGQRAQRRARERALAWRNRPPKSGRPLLQLDGWKKFREELIEQEQRTLEGREDVDDKTRYPLANPSVASVAVEMNDPFRNELASRSGHSDASDGDDDESSAVDLEEASRDSRYTRLDDDGDERVARPGTRSG